MRLLKTEQLLDFLDDWIRELKMLRMIRLRLCQDEAGVSNRPQDLDMP